MFTSNTPKEDLFFLLSWELPEEYKTKRPFNYEGSGLIIINTPSGKSAFYNFSTKQLKSLG